MGTFALVLFVMLFRLNSDVDELEEGIDDLETNSDELDKINEKIRNLRRGRYDYQKKIETVVRGLHNGVYNPNIITQKVNKIKSEEEQFPCSNCGISVMGHWEKCYHCGAEI